MVRKFTQFLRRLHRDEAGKMSVEMILLLALIALPIIILLAVFRHTIVGWFQTQQGDLTNQNN